MTPNKHNQTQLTLPSEREIAVVRTFDAPRELVWKMWTQAEHLVHWWGPKGWTLPVCEVDLRPGGTWFYCMQGPDGTRACGKAYYSEIVEPERLAYKDTFVDPDGNLLEGMPESEITVEFLERDGMTTVRSISRYATREDRDKIIEMGMEEGIHQTLDRLEAYLGTIT